MTNAINFIVNDIILMAATHWCQPISRHSKRLTTFSRKPNVQCSIFRILWSVDQRSSAKSQSITIIWYLIWWCICSIVCYLFDNNNDQIQALIQSQTSNGDIKFVCQTIIIFFMSFVIWLLIGRQLINLLIIHTSKNRCQQNNVVNCLLLLCIHHT